MSTWLKLLPLELQEIDPLIEPTAEIREGETVAGVVSGELRKVYTLWRSLEKQADLLAIEFKYRKTTNDELGKVAELKAKAEALMMIFWIGVNDDLNLWGHPEQLGIRTDWNVVEYKQPHLPFPFNFFPRKEQ